MVKWEPAIEAPRLADAAVQTRVLADGAVESAKIANLAVTNAEIMWATITKLQIGDQEVDIQRMLDPVDWNRIHDTAFDATLDTTWRAQVSTQLEVPSWAGEALIMATGGIQASNSSGGDINVAADIKFSADTPTGGASETVIDGTTSTAIRFDSTLVASPASTIDIKLWGQTNTGNLSTTNWWILDVVGLYKR